MVEPITITREEARARIREAYERGELVAQTSEPRGGVYWCQEGSNTYRCAIGALLPEDVARALERRQLRYENSAYPMVRELIRGGLLRVPDDDAQWFEDVQLAHDAWAGERVQLHLHLNEASEVNERIHIRRSVEDCRQRFLRLLEAEA